MSDPEDTEPAQPAESKAEVLFAFAFLSFLLVTFLISVDNFGTIDFLLKTPSNLVMQSLQTTDSQKWPWDHAIIWVWNEVDPIPWTTFVQS